MTEVKLTERYKELRYVPQNEGYYREVLADNLLLWKQGSNVLNKETEKQNLFDSMVLIILLSYTEETLYKANKYIL